MKVERLVDKGNARLLREWLEEYADEEYASLLDAAEQDTRDRLCLR